MAEFTSRDKTIASLLNWGLCILSGAYLIFVDQFSSFERFYTELVRLGKEGGLGVFEAQWFISLAISMAILLWARFVRKGLLRISPPWLGLALMWLFCIACGLLGFVLYLGNIFMMEDMVELVFAIVQGGVLSLAFPMLCLFGILRPLPGN